MAQIVPKLNLNKTPSIVENNSLVFAKNIRLDVDSTIHKDYGISPLSLYKENNYTQYKNIIYRAINDITKQYNNFPSNSSKEYYSVILNKLKRLVNYNGDTVLNFKNSSYGIVGVIPDSNEFYLCIYGTYSVETILSVEGVDINENKPKLFSESCIIVYDEKEDIFKPCNCNWNYSGGIIDGCVIKNLLGEKILNIGETSETDIIPLKCINLSKSSYDDDESKYTQTPKIPITNFKFIGRFSYIIPNGVYQFFIRYKIRDEFYTDWFPVSKECFAGNSKKTTTNFGTLKFVNTHTDSDDSFIFEVNHLYNEYIKLYESFQIGFILSHDDAIYGRAWKHFTFDKTIIKFDYKAIDSEEIEITEFIKPTYQIFNVGNITSFKNKLYISNYKESNFNENLQNIADDITITIGEQESSNSYGDYTTDIYTHGSKTYISALYKDGTKLPISGSNGIIYNLLSSTSIKTNVLDKLFSNNPNVSINASHIDYDCRTYIMGSDIEAAIQEKTKKITNRLNYVDGTLHFDKTLDGIENVKINGSYVGKTVDSIINRISSNVKYLSYDGNFVDSNFNDASSFKITIYRKCTYKLYMYEQDDTPASNLQTPIYDSSNSELNPLSSSIIQTPPDITIVNPGTIKPGVLQPGGDTVIKEIEDVFIQEITIGFNGDKNKVVGNDISGLTEYSTLIPYQQYKFYIHFVKETGEVTNGYLCGKENNILTAPYKANADSILYPIFGNIKKPDGYVACFFSIFHCATTSSTVFNLTKYNENDELKYIEGSCIELNTRLVPGSSRISCRQGNNNNIKNFNGDYYYSSDSTIIRYFGADGVIAFPKDSEIDITKNVYTLNDYESQHDNDADLIKCTPFISLDFSPLVFSRSYSDFNDMTLGGFICKVYPLDRERAINYYTDGNSIYKKDVKKENDTNPNASITQILLTELSKYEDFERDKIREFTLISTEPVSVYSNFNLNYLRLSEDIKETILSYYNTSSENTKDKAEPIQILCRLISSLTMSDVYNLPSMYKDYTRKVYSIYRENEVTKFDNTVRNSTLVGDESKVSVFKFDANDYYNVPTNRGIIINMVAVGDAILVHTQDSMFKFSGNNTLSSSDGEILQNESRPFDTGVTELFGSDFGFAGLQRKTDCILTENGYIFFDRDAKIIYMYTGNGQIVKLSDSIEKLFRYKPIDNIYFANDYYNNRFFVSIMFNNDVPVTLSFSLLDSIKNFVSLHDFYFLNAFNTKSNCYFLSNIDVDVCRIDKERLAVYDKMEISNDTFYPNMTEIKTFNVYDDETKQDIQIAKRAFVSIIDVINNLNYENVKTLNNVSWCSSNIDKEFDLIDNNNLSTLNMVESSDMTYPCLCMRIYTDTCMTNIMNFSKVSNRININDPNNYKYPRFNQGYWSLSYFRDIKNANNSFNYLDKYNDGRGNAPIVPDYRSDNNSLIEGKYFVIRFFFNNDFKLETLKLNFEIKS